MKKQKPQKTPKKPAITMYCDDAETKTRLEEAAAARRWSSSDLLLMLAQAFLKGEFNV